MNAAEYICKILYHTFCTLIICGAVARGRQKTFSLKLGRMELYRRDEWSRGIGVMTILCFCLLEGIYSFICGPYHVYLVDRGVFAARFIRGHYSRSSSVGLYYIQNILRQFTLNPDVLFFVVAFLFLLITMYAYNLSRDATPKALLYMCMSQYLLYGCYQLKQAMAAAFAALAIVGFLEKRKTALIMGTVCSIAFHESGLVLIPLFVIMYGSKSRMIQILGYTVLVSFVFFFSQSSRVAVRVVTDLIPSMKAQLAGYLDESGGIETGGSILAALKGFPIYYITLRGFLERRKLKRAVPDTDRYLLLCMFASIATASTVWMEWMWRFSELVYLPVFIFASRMREELPEEKRNIYDLVICGSLGFFTYRKLLISYFTYGGLV